jgi:hypothetical protein
MADHDPPLQTKSGLRARRIAVFLPCLLDCQPPHLRRTSSMKLVLRIDQLPQPSVSGIAIQRIPSTHVFPKLAQMRMCQGRDSFAHFVSHMPARTKDPLPSQYCFRGIYPHHRTASILAPAVVSISTFPHRTGSSCLPKIMQHFAFSRIEQG